MLSLLSLLDSGLDKARFFKLYPRFRSPMYRIALSILGSRDAAEDAVHDSFVKIIKNSEKISSLSCQELGGYIVIIVKRTSIDLLRRRSRLAPLPDELPDEGYSGDGYSSIVDAIRAMPEAYREVLELRFVLELDNREIAKRLGLSVSAVEQRVSRGRKLLQKYLIEEGIVDGR